MQGNFYKQLWRFLIGTSISFLLCRLIATKLLISDTKTHHDYEWVSDEWAEIQDRETVPLDHETVKNSIQELIDAIQQDTESHSAWTNIPTKKRNELCSVYASICNRTLRQWSFTMEQKYLYQWLIIGLINELNDRLPRNIDINKIIDSIMIYQSDTDGRWSASHDAVKINNTEITTLREFREVVTHELWHIVDLGWLQGVKIKRNHAFTEFGKSIWSVDDPSIPFYELSRINEYTRKKEASSKDFVSWYAMKWIYEDFAESHNLWINHNILFQKFAESNAIIAKKYAFFKTLYTNDRFDDNPKTATKIPSQKRPRDTTRIK
jgi:hypothetical protein